MIIDVGINRVEDKNSKTGFRLKGDVDYNDCFEKCGMITPVPGGVGPMTIAMLMRNTLILQKEQFMENKFYEIQIVFGKDNYDELYNALYINGIENILEEDGMLKVYFDISETEKANALKNSLLEDKL